MTWLINTLRKMVSTELYTLLTSVTTKVYPLVAPQGTQYPYVLYGMVSSDPSDTKDGDKLDTYMYQVTAIAEKYSEAEALAASIISVVDRHADVTNKIDKFIFAGQDESFDEEEQVYIRSVMIKVRETK